MSAQPFNWRSGIPICSGKARAARAIGKGYLQIGRYDERVRAATGAAPIYRLSYLGETGLHTVFAIAFNVAEVVLWAITAVQFLFKLFTGVANQQLRGFGQSLGTFMYDVILFLTFRSDEKPFPFAPWPNGAPGHVTAKRRSRAAKKTDDA
jgi:hypothetical protein